MKEYYCGKRIVGYMNRRNFPFKIPIIDEGLD